MLELAIRRRYRSGSFAVPPVWVGTALPRQEPDMPVSDDILYHCADSHACIVCGEHGDYIREITHLDTTPWTHETAYVCGNHRDATESELTSCHCCPSC